MLPPFPLSSVKCSMGTDDSYLADGGFFFFFLSLEVEEFSKDWRNMLNGGEVMEHYFPPRKHLQMRKSSMGHTTSWFPTCTVLFCLDLFPGYSHHPLPHPPLIPSDGVLIMIVAEVGMHGSFILTRSDSYFPFPEPVPDYNNVFSMTCHLRRASMVTTLTCCSC